LEIKPLSVIDATTGMAYEMQIVQARAALTQSERDYAIFLENLRLRYEAAAEEWALRDWALGFVRVPNLTETKNATNNP